MNTDYTTGSPRSATRGRSMPERQLESLIDEGVEDTFPASDPPAASYPGSSLWEMTRRERMARSQRTHAMTGVALGSLCVLAALALTGGRRRRARNDRKA